MFTLTVRRIALAAISIPLTLRLLTPLTRGVSVLSAAVMFAKVCAVVGGVCRNFALIVTVVVDLLAR